jgi:transcriptional regulator with XRE-family HTH domain
MDSSLGTRLRTQRERQGVTLLAIADETKISVALLEGLERDDVTRWPGGVYRRAYVRAYAHAIGLDPDATVREFLARHPDPVDDSALAEHAARDATAGGFFGARLSLFRRATVPAPPNTFERDLEALARVCTDLGCARDQETVTRLLADAGRILDARGLIVWVFDTVRAALCPALTFGYPDAVLRHLAALARSADNAIAIAFRTGQTRVVDGGGRESGALVTPLMAPDGCVGVLAIEFQNGIEHRQVTRAFAAILGAQLSTLLPASALAHAVSA